MKEYPILDALTERLKDIKNPTEEDLAAALAELRTEYNKQIAVNAKAVHTLSEILPLLDPDKLRNFAKIYGVEGFESIEKNEFIAKLIPAMMHPGKLEYAIYLIPAEMWDMFTDLLDERCITDNSKPADNYRFLISSGYVYLFYDDGNFTYVMPDEIIETFESLDTDEIFSGRDFLENLDEYAKAAVHLYGAITIQDYCNLVTKYEEYDEDDKVTADDVAFWIKNFCEFQDKYRVRDNYIVSMDFIKENGKLKRDAINALEDIRISKPRYLPDSDTFIKYADPDYYDITPEIKKLRKTLIHEGFDEDRVDDVISCLHDSIAAEEQIGEIISDLKYECAELEVQNIMGDLLAMKNNTKIWSNNGYSLNELRSITGASQIPALIRTTLCVTVL